jgi:hypothetical protein
MIKFAKPLAKFGLGGFLLGLAGAIASIALIATGNVILGLGLFGASLTMIGLGMVATVNFLQTNGNHILR